METASQTILSPEWTSAPTALQSRMQQLQHRVEECQRRLEDQNQSVADICRGALELQAQAAALKRRLEDMGRRLQELGVGVASIPPAAEPLPAAASPMPAAPETPGAALPPEDRKADASRNPAKGLLQCLPYLLIAAAGIGYGLTGHAVEAGASSPRRPSGDASAVAGASTTGDPGSEALRLVYEYRLPGTDQDMLDLIGSQEEALGPSPWEIECDENSRCDVSFTSRSVAEEEPLYGFEVDLGAKTVTPSPETAERLLSASVAQNGAG